jgi:hypothetical protein
MAGNEIAQDTNTSDKRKWTTRFRKTKLNSSQNSIDETPPLATLQPPIRRQPKRGTPVVEVVINTTPAKRKHDQTLMSKTKTANVTPTIRPDLEQLPSRKFELSEQPIQPTLLPSPDRLTKSASIMPESCLNVYKRAILRNLQSPDSAPPNLNQSAVNDTASQQLSDLIDGTVTRAEGNSCLLLGPRGSGKSRVCISQYSS